jgi:hypothetical protein
MLNKRSPGVRLTTLILIEAPSSASHRGTAGVGSTTSTTSSGGDRRRFDTPPHQCYGGIDRQARPRARGVVHQDGAGRRHRQMQAAPAPWLTAMAPDREALVVGGAWRFTWEWRAARGARAGRPCVRGPARSMPALPGGQAPHDHLDAQHIAVRRPGGLRPQAAG